MTSPALSASKRQFDCDVAILGGGLSGTIVAIALARRGVGVVLVDRHLIHPAEFRVEKIGGEQVEKLTRLGLIEALASEATPFDEIVNLSRGRVLDRTRSRHYGIFYHDLVNLMRRQLPASARFIHGRVTGLETGPELQRVSIAERGTVTARLVVLATGMGDVLKKRLGITREVIEERHSMSFGFNVARAGRDIPGAPALTYYGEHCRDGIDYLSLFPVGDTMRANLFSYCGLTDPWVKLLRGEPEAALAGALPGLSRVLGPLQIRDKVQSWVMDLAVARNVAVDGVVLIGDAYQTSCPAAGTGVSRLLTDVECLAGSHVPAWLTTSGMPAAKLASFYADPEKQAMDARALALAHYRRSLTIDTSGAWRLRRQLARTRRRLVAGLDRLSPALVDRLRTARTRPA
jgi:2-polyprenyl-6-methoxyphenol hydroxylase-like FAD-dependent oxidoreductase